MLKIRPFESDEARLLKSVRLEALQDSPLAFATSYYEAKGLSANYWLDRGKSFMVRLVQLRETGFCTSRKIKTIAGQSFCRGFPDKCTQPQGINVLPCGLATVYSACGSGRIGVFTGIHSFRYKSGLVHCDGFTIFSPDRSRPKQDLSTSP